MAKAHFLEGIDPSTPLAAGRWGAATATAGVTMRRLGGLSIASIVSAKGAAPAVIAAIEAAHGLAIVDRPEVCAGTGLCCVGTGPGKWLAVAPRDDGEAFADGLAAAVGAAASVNDQSDGFVIFELAGARIRAALAKCLGIDLDPPAFVPGSAATTLMALVGVTLWQIDEAPVYHLCVGRSLAEAATRALAAAGAEYGFELTLD